MSSHFYFEIEKLKKSILGLCTLVEESVKYSVTSVLELDYELAGKVIVSDNEIDTVEVEIEEDCLKILALYQPVAKDLRFIVSVLKINNDLERIADLSVNIAERTTTLESHPPVELRDIFISMSEKAVLMLKKSIDSLIQRDTDLALSVLVADDEVDSFYKNSFGLVNDLIHINPSQTSQLLHYSSIFRHLERIADQTTNIAEDVIYMLKGGIIRHRKEFKNSHANELSISDD